MKFQIYFLFFIIFFTANSIMGFANGLSCPIFVDRNEQVPLIFIGTLISKEYTDESVGRLDATFKITEVFKGNYTNQVTLATFEDDIWGIDFEEGSKYIVYAEYFNGILSIDPLCGGTLKITDENSELIKQLRNAIYESPVPTYSITSDLIRSQISNSEGMSLESMEFFRTLYFAKLVAEINESIQYLPDDVFFDSSNKDDFREILVSGDNNIYDLFSKSNFFYFDPKKNINNFYEATTKLSELKSKMDSSIGGNPSDDWILEENSQTSILVEIDYALYEYTKSVGENLNPVSVDDYDENWWHTIRIYQENAKLKLAYLCYLESVKQSPYEVQINFEIPECQTWLAKSFAPNKQIKVGMESDKVQCDEGLELIFKYTDNSPACVKPTTVEKLVERGWANTK
jgi:hypothetical protein